MATDLERLTLQLEVNMRSYERGMARAAAAANQTTTGIERRFARADMQVSRSFRNMAQAGVAAFAALAGARAVGRAVGNLVEISDTYQQLENQVNSASAAVGHSLATMEDIAAVARRSRTGLEGTVMLYTRLERSAMNLNMTQEQTLRVTELVGKSFAASGATIQEQRSSILQLSQALQSGILQGDELRSLREGAPEIARAIATQMGVGIGALKELGSQGLITSDVVMNAILNAGTTIENQFDRTHATVAQAMTGLRNAFIMAVGSSEEAGGATGELAQAIINLADTIETNKEGIADFVGLLGDIASGAVNAASAIGQMYAALNTNLGNFDRTSGGNRTLMPVSAQEIDAAMESIRQAQQTLAQYATGSQLGGTRANQIGSAIGPDLMRAEGMGVGAYSQLDGQAVNSLAGLLQVRMDQLQIARDTLNGVNDLRTQRDQQNLSREQIGVTPASAGSPEQTPEQLAAAAAYAAAAVARDGDVSPRIAPRNERQAQMDTAKNEAMNEFAALVARTRADNKREAYELGIEQAAAYQEELQNRHEQLREQFGSVFAEGMMSTFDGNLKEFLQKQLRDVLSNAFASLGEQLFSQLFSGGGKGGGGLFSQLTSSLFGGGGFPGKALGGPVRAGQPYVVGEHGPELMIPDKAGRIVPRLPSAGAAAMITYAPNYAIDARGATSDAIAELRREMAAARQADLQQFGARVRGVLPGALASAQRDGAV